MKSDITIENVEKTLDKMAVYNKDIDNQFREIVKTSSKNIASNAKSNVNSVTGTTKQGIKPKYFRKGGPAATVLPRKVPHRHLTEYGTKPRVHKSGKSVGSARARPYMKPAADKEAPSYERLVRKLVEKVVTI